MWIGFHAMTSWYLQVSPVEVEELIQSLDGVSDAAVVAVPDVLSGEVPRAYVIRSNSDVTEEGIHACMKGKSIDEVATFQVELKHQVITSANVDQVLCRHIASLSHSELMI